MILFFSICNKEIEWETKFLHVVIQLYCTNLEIPIPYIFDSLAESEFAFNNQNEPYLAKNLRLTAIM